MSAPGNLQRLSSEFSAIAASIEARQAEAAVTDALATAQATAQAVARSRGPTEVTALAANLSTALQTWGSVWPRLGQRAEFRQAVLREATMWSKRLVALAKDQAGG